MNVPGWLSATGAALAGLGAGLLWVVCWGWVATLLFANLLKSSATGQQAAFWVTVGVGYASLFFLWRKATASRFAPPTIYWYKAGLTLAGVVALAFVSYLYAPTLFVPLNARR
jgi:hypothetical protein